MRRTVTPVSWIAAPEWLTVQEACDLSGHDVETVQWLIRDGAVEARYEDGRWLIEKASLREFQEALLLVYHWQD